MTARARTCVRRWADSLLDFLFGIDETDPRNGWVPSRACSNPGCECSCNEIHPKDTPCVGCEVNGCKETGSK